MKSLAPIILFVYNRLDHTRQTVEALKNNILASQSELIIFSDAAPTAEVEVRVREVRTFVRQVSGFKKVSVVERERNFGLAANIINGVTQLVNIHGKVIVVEDDIVTSPFFLSYMNDALEFYKDAPRVMHVSGYMYPINTEGLEDVFFLRSTSCWGWGTWSRAWKNFEKKPVSLLSKFNRKMIREFNLDGAYNYWKQLELNLEGKIDTWAIFWYASVFLNDGLSLHPKCSFVTNIGHEGSGVHRDDTDVFKTFLADSYVIKYDHLRIELDQKANAELKNFYQSIRRSLFVRVRDKLARLCSFLSKSSSRKI